MISYKLKLGHIFVTQNLMGVRLVTALSSDACSSGPISRHIVTLTQTSWDVWASNKLKLSLSLWRPAYSSLRAFLWNLCIALDGQGGKQTLHRQTLLSTLKSPSMILECLLMAFYALENYLVCIEYVLSCQLEFELFKCLQLSWACGGSPATPALECKAGKPQVQNSLA